MRKLAIVFSVLLLMFLASTTASAATITYSGNWEYNKDGTINSSVLPPSLLPGTLTVSIGLGPAGNHSVLSFIDPEIDEDINTYFNEYGSTVGTPATGQSWEIDEPGYVFGDIYTNFTNGALDNSNGVPSSAPDDVSMALGWDFNLTATQTATISFKLSADAPTGGFYLVQTDPDSAASIYFSSTLNIEDHGTNPTVPEPSTVVLLLSGLGLVAAARFRKSA